MCGIAGMVSFDPRRAVSSDEVLRMTRALVHRGPDDEGLHAEGPAALGFRRLAIVDLRPEGNQPHFNEDRSVFSVVNGEIYNHDELRTGLRVDGHVLRSRCDVEVVPHLYEKYGVELMDKLNGQFALAVYDGKHHRLLLARDPVGVCPLFYTVVDDCLLFASEIKGLLAHPAVSRELNLRGLDQILAFPGLASPTTMFRTIRSLPAGHFLELDNGRLRTGCYWDLDYPPDAQRTPPADWREQLDHLLQQAVSRRLQADVPVACYLSGGLDSSMVAGVMHKLRPASHWHAFSVVFDDAALDERRYQRLMAERIGARHHEVPFGPDDIAQRLRAVIRHAESPLKESYDTCSHALSQAVRDSGCKVVLSGEGADELFAGYVGYRFDMMRAGQDGATDLLDEDSWRESQLRETLWGDPDFFYERDYGAFRDMSSALYAPDIARDPARYDCLDQAAVDHARVRGRHPVHKRSYIDFKLRIADHLLSDHGDRMTFAHSVEGRYPFLDKDLIDFVTRLPPGLLTEDGREKYPLRAIASPYVAPQVLAREKFSFVGPGSPDILRGGHAWLMDLLAPDTIRRQGYLNPDTVARLRKACEQDGCRVNQTFDVDLMMVVLSFQIFLEEFSVPARC
ncbi:MAG TPA: asparagine synthase (glutamine-hydrolyzing) [Noviherbaspirillum sp.]